MLIHSCREELRDQHAIGEEIGEAITQSIGNQGYDEAELEDELDALQQEVLDERLTQTGHVPIADKVGAMPSAPQTGWLEPLSLTNVLLY
jgi:charged multivesicular body protein 4